MPRLFPLVSSLLVLVACGGGASPTAPTVTSGPPTSIAPPRPVGFAAPLPAPRTEVGGAAWLGKLAVGGGLEASGRASDDLYLYDPTADSWAKAPKLPARLHHFAFVVPADDRLWLIGGYTMTSDGGWRPSSSVWSLGASEKTWKKEAPLSAPRGALAAAVVGGVIVAVGGTTDGGGNPDEVSRVAEFLTPGASEWTRAPDLFEPREHLAMTVHEGRVLAIGGRTGSLDSTLRSVESWSVGEGTWRREKPLKKARAGFGATDVSGVPCIAGGEQSDRTISLVECMRNGNWSVIGQLREARHGLAVSALAGRLHVIAGGPKPGLTVSESHEVLDVG